MPWRMIVLILVLVVFAIFAGFNLDPIAISVGFTEFENVPTFLALLIAFVIGTIVMLPYTLRGFRRKKAKRHPTEVPSESLSEELPPESEYAVTVEENAEEIKTRRKRKKKTP